MRQLSVEARLHLRAHSPSASGWIGTTLHLAALYGALAVIAVIIFGTLSVHPF